MQAIARDVEASHPSVSTVYRCRIYFDECFIVLGSMFLNLSELNNLRWPMFFINNRFARARFLSAREELMKRELVLSWYYPFFILLLMITFPCLNRSLGRNFFAYLIASLVNPPRELSSFTPFFASLITSSFVHSRFGHRYPNIRGFRQYLLVFSLKLYNLLSKEFSLHLPTFMVPRAQNGP